MTALTHTSKERRSGRKDFSLSKQWTGLSMPLAEGHARARLDACRAMAEDPTLRRVVVSELYTVDGHLAVYFNRGTWDDFDQQSLAAELAATAQEATH